MQVHEMELGRVITLDVGEQFRIAPPQTPDPQWYATRAETVTVIKARGEQGAYFTVAGQQIHAPLTAENPFWEMPVQFTDAGLLPPHVRGAVEDLVPVRDARDAGSEQETAVRRLGFELAPTQVQERVVGEVQEADLHADLSAELREPGRARGEHAGGVAPLRDVGSSKSWAQRLAERNRGLGLPETHSGLPVRLPQEVTAEQGAWRRLDAQSPPLSPHRAVPQALPPSAFLDRSQVRGGR